MNTEIFIIYHDLDYDGCSPPCSAWSNEEAADAELETLNKGATSGTGYYEKCRLLIDCPVNDQPE